MAISNMVRSYPSLLLPITYMGPISCYIDIYKFNDVYIESYENYTKQTYRNRCVIASANGPLNLIVPVCHTGKKMPIKEVKINYSEAWQKKHGRAILAAYKKSPFFEFYEDKFSVFYNKKILFLFDLNVEIMDCIINLLKISKKINFTTEYLATPNMEDHRILLNQNIIYKTKEYSQVFREKNGFIANLSILDLIFNIGPNTSEYLSENSTI